MCEFHCQQCKILTRIRYCINARKNHDSVDLAEFEKVRKQEIKNETARIIPKYNNTDADFQVK